MHKSHLYLLYIRSEQSKCSKSCRTYCKTLTGCSCSISKSIKNIGALPYLRVQLTHLRVSSGIIGYRTVSISCKCNSQSRKHPDSSYSYAIETQTQIFCT